MRKQLAAGIVALAVLLSVGVPTAMAAGETPAPVTKPVTRLKLSVDGLSIKYKATSVPVIVDTVRGGAWTATAKDSWVHVTPESGIGDTTVTVSVDENPLVAGDDTVRRQSRVTFVAGDHTVVFPITQSAHVTIVKMLPLNWRPDWHSQDQAFTFDTFGTGVGFDCPVISSDSPWVTVTQSSYDPVAGTGGFTLHVEQFNGTLERKAVLLLNCAHGSNTFRVWQAPIPPLSATLSPFTLTASGQEASTVIASPYGLWTAQVTSGADWLTISATSGQDGAPVTLLALPNSKTARTGKITVTDGASQFTWTVTQKKNGKTTASVTATTAIPGGTVAPPVTTSTSTTNLFTALYRLAGLILTGSG